MCSMDNLLTYYRVMASEERVMPHETRRILFDACLGCTAAFIEADGNPTPKFHLWVHWSMQLVKHGNARFYNTYVDESLNGTIKEIAKRCSSLTCSESVFRRILLGDPLLYADR